MAVHHNTKQKSVILEALEKNRNHITADDLINALVTSGEKVGRATVYRFLHELEDQGRVRKYTMGEKNTAYYQYLGDNPCHGHFHLMCDVCGKLEHLDNNIVDAFIKNAVDKFGFEIDCSKTVFYGKCKECQG